MLLTFLQLDKDVMIMVERFSDAGEEDSSCGEFLNHTRKWDLYQRTSQYNGHLRTTERYFRLKYNMKKDYTSIQGTRQ